MENLTEKLKNISKEDIMFFIIGITFGMLMYAIYRFIRYQKRMEKEIDETIEELKKVGEKQQSVEAQKTSNTQTSNFSTPQPSNTIFPLKFGKKGEEVKMLQAWLIENFEDTELEDSKEYKDSFFGKLTKSAVIKHTDRDKGAISKDFFERKIAPFFNKIEEGED